MEFLERIGDFFNWLFATFERFITRRFGAANERVLKKLGYIRDKRTQQSTILPGSTLDRINKFEPEIEKLSEEELRGSAEMFRARLKAARPADASCGCVTTTCR